MRGAGDEAIFYKNEQIAALTPAMTYDKNSIKPIAYCRITNT
ncbi:MAG: hypothetical protein ACK5IQ_09560 [Bacteroidales bacterium]